MLFEYAVEPQAIGSSWQNFRYLIEKFGFDRGRLISRFPKKWEREVIEAAQKSGMGDVRLKSVVSRLQKAKLEALIASGRSYDPEVGDWLQNALLQHALNPFHAIIASANGGAYNFVLAADEIHAAHPLFASPVNWEVQRVGSSLASAMAPLLQTARQVLLVDKYFKFDDPRYKETLREALLTISAGGQGCFECEVHIAEYDRGPPITHIEQNVGRWLRGVIPNGMSLKIFCWKEKQGGEDFHARYLLTDRGGLNVEAGFSADGAHQRVQLTLLDFALARTKSGALTRGSAVYDLVQPVLEIGSDGTVHRI